ncbi:MAG TPA: lectin-like protein [Nevskiales bacterium]|nr:lectin-like protein [Nevskiales bacterium]
MPGPLTRRLLAMLVLVLPVAPAFAVTPCASKAPGNYTETWTQNSSVGPIQRSWIVHIPPGYNGTRTFSTILNFHGNTSSASGQEGWSKMSQKADAAGFIVVYPEGYKNSWNVGRDCCGEALANNIDDVGFTRHIVQHLKDNYCVDPQRIYVTGMSAGAGMAAKLGCQAADLFAGVSVVSGAFISPPCEPSRPIAELQFWGTSDPYVSSTDAYNTRDTYLAVNQCGSTPTRTYTNNKATCDTYNGCSNGVQVTFCKIEGMGHCWPGNSCTAILQPGTGDIFANDEMWDFFQQFTLTSSNTCPQGFTDLDGNPANGCEHALPAGCSKAGVRNGKRYYLCGWKSWSQAKSSCEALGGYRLVKIEDAAENAWVSNLRGTMLSWIGANDIAVEGQWRWTDDSAVSYAPWASGQPNNYNNQDCGHYYQDNVGQWGDEACGKSLRYVCEQN